MTPPDAPSPVDPEPPKGPLERALALVADVRASETGSVVTMALTMFLLLGSYYMLKTAREALILTRGGAEVKTYSAAGQAILLLGFIPAFSALASRVNRVNLIKWVTLFFASNLVLFILFGQNSRFVGVVYFLWIGIFNVMVIAQFWAFANDLYTPEQGKRVFPVIGLGSSLGAWIGSVFAGRIIAVLGPFPLMGIACGVLCVCMGLAIVADRLQARSATPKAHAERSKALGNSGAFQLVLSSRYLTFIALLVVLTNVVNTSGEYIFGRLVEEASVQQFGATPASAPERERFVGATYAQFFGFVNLAGFLIQMLLVSRIFAWFGVVGSLLIHPMVALCGYLLMLRAPSIGIVQAFKVADNSLDYSLDNTARQALWLPTSRDEKYKAKQAVDSFFMRLGDVLQAGVVYVGGLLSFGVPAFAVVNVVLTAAWLAVVGGLNPMYRDRVGQQPDPKAKLSPA